jgi:hypothetical protein
MNDRLLGFSLLAATTAAACGAASCALAAPCVGAGVITRIDGDPAAVSISRAGAPVARPRVLEVVCVGDRIAAAGATRLTLSIDGRGQVRVDARAPYVVAARAGAPTLAGNAYRAVNEQVMPDMKRLPWDVRLKGGEVAFAFALSQLPAGIQEISSGAHPLLVRVIGGSGPYRVTLTGPGGQALGQAAGQGDLNFPVMTLVPGRYHLAAVDATGAAIAADFSVSAAPPTLPDTYATIDDPEVRAAATACELARVDSQHRGLAAEELLAEAPANGLDRTRVYTLIESYGADD